MINRYKEFIAKLGVDTTLFESEEFDLDKIYENEIKKIENTLLKSSETLKKRIDSEKIGITNSIKNKLYKAFEIDLTAEEIKDIKIEDAIEQVKASIDESDQYQTLINEAKSKYDNLLLTHNKLIKDYENTSINHEKQLLTARQMWEKELAEKIEVKDTEARMKELISKNKDTIIGDIEDVYLLISNKIEKEGMKIKYSETEGVHLVSADGIAKNKEGSYNILNNFDIIKQYAGSFIKQSNGNEQRQYNNNNLNRLKEEKNEDYYSNRELQMILDAQQHA